MHTISREVVQMHREKILRGHVLLAYSHCGWGNLMTVEA